MGENTASLHVRAEIDFSVGIPPEAQAELNRSLQAAGVSVRETAAGFSPKARTLAPDQVWISLIISGALQQIGVVPVQAVVEALRSGLAAFWKVSATTPEPEQTAPAVNLRITQSGHNNVIYILRPEDYPASLDALPDHYRQDKADRGDRVWDQSAGWEEVTQRAQRMAAANRHARRARRASRARGVRLGGRLDERAAPGNGPGETGPRTMNARSRASSESANLAIDVDLHFPEAAEPCVHRVRRGCDRAQEEDRERRGIERHEAVNGMTATNEQQAHVHAQVLRERSWRHRAAGAESR